MDDTFIKYNTKKRRTLGLELFCYYRKVICDENYVYFIRFFIML